MLKAYEETIGMLTGWKPPLNLIFRRAPVREGWLKKSGVSKKKVCVLGGFGALRLVEIAVRVAG